MPYSVLQISPEPLTTDQLKLAFRGVPGLTEMDAFTLGKGAFGILVKGFELDRATALKNSLETMGVASHVVDDSALPPLPDAFFLGHIDCTPDALLMYDQLGREASLDWKDIQLIAAGKVRLTDFHTALVPHLATFRGQPTGIKYEAETKEQPTDHWLMEIFAQSGTLRYSLTADHPGILFQCLRERRTKDLATNFSLLIQDMLKFAPGVAINRGAYYFRENSGQVLSYPNKTAFYNEITWLLWQLSGKEPGPV